MGMCVLGGGGEEKESRDVPLMWQNFLLCLWGCNWDAKPARRSHPSFPFSLSVILSKQLWQLWLVMAAAATTSHPRGFLSLSLSLSHDFLFPVQLPASPTHRLPWPGSVGGVATRGETVEARRKTLTGRMAGAPPPPSSPLPLPHLSCTDTRWEEKVVQCTFLLHTATSLQS